jgi:hypothetical protein
LVILSCRCTSGYLQLTLGPAGLDKPLSEAVVSQIKLNVRGNAADKYQNGDVPCHPSAWLKAQQRWVEVRKAEGSLKVLLNDIKGKGKGGKATPNVKGFSGVIGFGRTEMNSARSIFSSRIVLDATLIARYLEMDC